MARALVGRPSILILDEPTNHLDEAAVTTLLSGIEALDPPVTLVVITHDVALARTMDRVIRLERGRIVAEDSGLRA